MVSLFGDDKKPKKDSHTVENFTLGLALGKERAEKERHRKEEEREAKRHREEEARLARVLEKELDLEKSKLEERKREEERDKLLHTKHDD